MSDPARKPAIDPASSDADAALSQRLAQRKRRERRDRQWIIGTSILLHAAAVTVLLYLTPWQSLIDQAEAMTSRSSAARNMSANEIEQLDERMMEAQRREVLRRIERLASIQQELQNIEVDQADEYEPFAARQLTEAPQNAAQAAEQAAQAAKDAAEALEQGDVERASEQQARAEQLQEQAIKKLTLTGSDHAAKPLESQKQARDEQREATDQQNTSSDRGRQQREAQKQLDQAKSELEKVQNRNDERTKSLSEQQKKLEAAQATLDERKKELETLKEQIEQTAQEHKQADAEAKKKDKQTEQDKKDAKKREEERKQHRKEKSQLEKKVKEADSKRKSEQSRLDKAKREIESAKKKIDEQAKKVEEAQAKLERIEKAREEAQQAAVKAQQEAAERQAQVAKEVAEIAKPLGEETAEAAGEMPPAAQPAEPINVAQLEGKSLAELYEHARQAEQKITDSFENVRAMELAVLRDATLEEALASVDDVTPLRPEPDLATINARVRSAEQLQVKREAVSEAVGQTQAMVDLAELLLSQLQRETNTNANRLAMALATVEQQATEQAQATEQSAAAAVGETEVEVEVDQEQTPRPEVNVRQASHGRRIAADGIASAGWVAVDDWYIIGPWDNTGRRNLTRQFPPESVVDLDAVYPGKGGRAMRWTFYNTTHPQGMVDPDNAEPYGVWYGYTELMFDQPTTLWVAVGSDDRGTLWINGKEVWVSAPHHKDWKPGEAVIRVDFKAGRNTVLFRCENGQFGMGFSMLLYTGEAMKPN